MNKYFYALNRRFWSLYISLFDTQFDNNDNFQLNNLEKYFQDQPSNFVDRKKLKQISEYYKNSKEIQNQKNNIYQIGSEWMPIYEKYMSEIQDILIKGNLDDLSKKYNNFFREKFSTGLHGDSGYERFKKRYLSKKISFIDKNLYVKKCLNSFKNWKKLIDEKKIDVNLDDLIVPSIGNAYNFEFNGRLINPNYFISNYYANYSSKLVNQKSNKRKIIFELGGGYGAYAYFLNKKNDYCYIGCDLPENLSLTAFFLKSLLPNKNIKLITDLKKEKVDFNKFDIVLISNYDIENLPNNIIDLTFNSYSLGEMHTEAVYNYIEHICRITNGTILHINHTLYSKVSADDFNIDLKKFKLISKEPVIWNRYINKFSDEFEYLYVHK
jgi:putative sugar O-methyltransferase